MPPSAFPSLQEIDLAFTPVGDAGLLALARTSPQLKVLRLSPSEAGGNLWSVGTWGAQSVVEIKRLLPALSVLHTTC